jgi:hypothetical protein
VKFSSIRARDYGDTVCQTMLDRLTVGISLDYSYRVPGQLSIHDTAEKRIFR